VQSGSRILHCFFIGPHGGRLTLASKMVEVATFWTWALSVFLGQPAAAAGTPRTALGMRQPFRRSWPVYECFLVRASPLIHSSLFYQLTAAFPPPRSLPVAKPSVVDCRHGPTPAPAFCHLSFPSPLTFRMPLFSTKSPHYGWC